MALELLPDFKIRTTKQALPEKCLLVLLNQWNNVGTCSVKIPSQYEFIIYITPRKESKDDKEFCHIANDLHKRNIQMAVCCGRLSFKCLYLVCVKSTASKCLKENKCEQIKSHQNPLQIEFASI